MKPRIKYRNINNILVLLVLPYLEPTSINLLITRGINESLWNMVGNFLSIGRLVASSVFFAMLLVKKGKRRWIFHPVLLLVVMSIGRLIASLVNGSAPVGALVTSYNLIGLVGIISYYYQEDTEKTLNTLKRIMLYMVGANIISIVLSLKANQIVQNPVFFLGGKNAAFSYILILFESWYLYALHKEQHLPKTGFFISLVLMIIAFLSDASTIAIITLLMCIFTIAERRYVDYLRINPILLAGIALAIEIIVLGGYRNSIISNITLAFGRDTTYTGRYLIWGMAIKYYLKDPLFGCGDSVSYPLVSGDVMTQAHNQLLEFLSKDGLITYIPYLIILVFIVLSTNQKKNRMIQGFISIIMFAYLLHGIVDVMPLFQISLFLSVLLLETMPERKSMKKLLRKSKKKQYIH